MTATSNIANNCNQMLFFIIVRSYPRHRQIPNIFFQNIIPMKITINGIHILFMIPIRKVISIIDSNHI